MDTVAPTFACRHTRIRIATERPTEFVDLTDSLERLVAGAGLTVGFVNVQTLHTTTALVVNEHEPLLLEDFAALLESAASKHGAQMTAMGNASKNASGLIDAYTLAMNRARQAEITQEILEVVAGADALTT